MELTRRSGSDEGTAGGIDGELQACSVADWTVIAIFERERGEWSLPTLALPLESLSLLLHSRSLVQPVCNRVRRD
jgi:hypothetical protein